MADRKITDLTALAAGSQATGDLLTIVDVSEAAATDKNKKITVESLFKGIPGDVGIGTSSPSHKLNIDSTSDADLFRIRSTADANNTNLRFGISGSVSEIHASGGSSGNLAFKTYGSERMRIDTLGNVGIGISSPGSRVHVFDSNPEVQLQSSGTSTNCEYSMLGRDGSNVAHKVNIKTAASALTFGTGGSSGNSYVPSERMRIDSSGRVGIGTTSPSMQDGNSNPVVHLYAASSPVEFRAQRGNGCDAFFTARSTELQIGTNTQHRIEFRINDTERMRIDSSGRLLVGTSTARNKVYNGTTSVNVPQFQTEVSGSGVTSRAMITGNPGTNTSEVGPALILARSTGTTDNSYSAVTASANHLGQVSFQGADGSEFVEAARIEALVDGTPGANAMPGRLAFKTNSGGSSPTERMRIDSSGRLLIGSTSARANFYHSVVSPQVQQEGSGDFDRQAAIISSSSTGHFGAAFILAHQKSGSQGGNTALANSDVSGLLSFQANDGSHFLEHARIQAFVDGASGTDDMPGALQFFTAADGAQTVTERMRINSSGRVTFKAEGYSGNPGYSTTGVSINDTASGNILCTRSGAAPGWFNRLSNDGTLIDFAQDTTIEGTISVSGSTVSYNGGHLSRWSQLASGAERTEILRGSVLSNLDEMCEWAYEAQDAVLYTEDDELPEGVSVGDVKTPAVAAGTEDNEQLNRMKVSDVEGDRNVAGVFQGWDDDDDTYTNDFYCAMTGDFIIRIAQGTTVARGDLLMSAGDGTAKPQDDDIVRSKTIAKVTSTTVSTTYADGSYCVPCVLMAC